MSPQHLLSDLSKLAQRGAPRVPTSPLTSVGYWRDGVHEVDFVVSSGSMAVAVEVKSGRQPGRLAGLDRFRRDYPDARLLVVGSGGIHLDEFLSTPAERWLR